MADKQAVYVVERGDYSDRRILAICSTKEKADAFARPINDDVTEYVLDEYEWQPEWHAAAVASGTHAYFVSIEVDSGNIRRLGASFYASQDREVGSYRVQNRTTGPGYFVTVLEFDVWARDDDHARKIAGEKRSEWLAWKAVQGETPT